VTRLHLRPADERFGDLLAALAGHVVAGARLLGEVLGAEQLQREEAARQLQVVDQNAEAGAHAFLRTLSAAFVTPFDRVDLYRLCWALRQCTGRIEAAADEIVLFQLADVPSGVLDLVQLVVRAADVTAEAIPRLPRPGEIASSWIELTRQGKQAGQAHRRLLAEVSAASTDPVVLTRLVAVAESLRRVLEAFEDVADALQTVAVREG
jgi:hypothetical protein